MIQGLVEGGLARENTEVMLDEMQAVQRAMSMLTDHDVVVVLADNVPGVLDLLSRQQPRPA